MKKYLLIIIVAIAVQVNAQKDGEDITIGKYRTIQSKELDEERLLLVNLPDSYESSNKSYPVVFMLYGDYLGTYFYESAAIINQLGSRGETPEFILVGVGNTSRYRDLLPLNRQGNSDDIKRFQAFVKNELIPFIDKEYRTVNHRVLVAPQAGSAFSYYNMNTEPGMFNSYIIESSFRFREPVYNFLDETIKELGEKKTLPTSVFIAYNESTRQRNKDIVSSFSNLAEQCNINYHAHMSTTTGHMRPMCLREGLHALYSDYQLPSDYAVNGLEDLKSYYKKISDKYDYDVKVPSRVLIMEGDKLQQKGNIDEAKKVFEYAIKLDPKELNSLMRLGQIYEDQKDYKKAIEYYEAFLEVRNEPFVVSKLKGLKEKIAND